MKPDNTQDNKVSSHEMIKDMRGETYYANYMTIEKGKLYYCGMLVKYLWKSTDTASNYFYDIIVLNDVIAGTIALREDELKRANSFIGYKSEPHSLNPHPERNDDGY